MTDDAPAASYAEAIAELERLLSDLEAAEPDIDALGATVARAAELISFCRGCLTEARVEVERIVAELDPDVTSEGASTAHADETGTS